MEQCSRPGGRARGLNGWVYPSEQWFMARLTAAVTAVGNSVMYCCNKDVIKSYSFSRLFSTVTWCRFLFISVLANGCFSDWVLFCCVYAWYTLKVLNNPARVIKCVAWKWRSCFNTPDVSTVIFSRQTGNSLMLFPFYTESPISSAVSIERGSIEFRVQNDVCWCVYQTIVFCIDSRSGSRFAVSIFQSVVRQSGLILRHC